MGRLSSEQGRRAQSKETERIKHNVGDRTINGSRLCSLEAKSGKEQKNSMRPFVSSGGNDQKQEGKKNCREQFNGKEERKSRKRATVQPATPAKKQTCFINHFLYLCIRKVFTQLSHHFFQLAKSETIL